MGQVPAGRLIQQELTDRPVLGSEFLSCMVHRLHVPSLTQESMYNEEIVKQDLQRELRAHTSQSMA